MGLVSQERTRSRQHAMMMAPTHWDVSGATVGPVEEGSFLKPRIRFSRKNCKLKRQIMHWQVERDVLNKVL